MVLIRSRRAFENSTYGQKNREPVETSRLRDTSGRLAANSVTASQHHSDREWQRLHRVRRQRPRCSLL